MRMITFCNDSCLAAALDQMVSSDPARPPTIGLAELLQPGCPACHRVPVAPAPLGLVRSLERTLSQETGLRADNLGLHRLERRELEGLRGAVDAIVDAKRAAESKVRRGLAL
jgi:hypothetical protein